ncbi:E3 ubiquitin-protein ligase Iruka isoform X1 [Anopheles moucheti]|uniref:E3 ubiquitin-protein ligase Iruka isoform X1 n=1 Tax=Anopheles moucheti TaxID=186751 RepID=UPI0022F0492B|nr:E3 ubiquitin-protein ligase Iruka isoform X1 [Anopheles moucheti]
MEALVENAAAPPSRFYCHSCAIEIDRVSSEFTCPHCLEGFIEELPAAERGGAAGSAAGQDTEQPSSDYDNPQFSNEQAIRLAGEIFTNSILSPFFRRSDGQDGESASGAGAGGGEPAMFIDDIPMDGSSGPSSGVPLASGTAGGEMGDGAAGSSSAGSGDTRPSMRYTGRRGSRRRGVQNINHVDQILREILISVSGGASGAGASGPMFFMGNPGDYAWGREGIDTIVTQLLNQMDNTGPPPLEKERIAQIPTVTINEEQVEKKLQCSVCFEDFVVGESVRKLPCLHVYHDPCIIPWLELHGTCPICRNSLTPEDSHGGAQSQSQDSAQSHSDSSQPHQQASQPQSDSGRQNSNFLTFTIHDLLPTLSGPAMTNLLFEMAQPLAATASSVSSSLPPTASGSGANSGAGTGTTTNGDVSTTSRNNTGVGGASTSGGSNGSQPSNSQRDEDGTIDYTLELD